MITMTMRELRKYKKHHCYHSCYHCEHRETCWNELGVEPRKPIHWKFILMNIVLPSVIGFLVMFWLINIICNSYMM